MAIAAALTAAVLSGACSGAGLLQQHASTSEPAAPRSGGTPMPSASAESLLSTATLSTSTTAIADSSAPLADREDRLDAGAAAAAAMAGAAPSECPDPKAQLLLPDGGIVFNNAMTSADAGYLDRTQGVIDVLSAQAARFRCCFDPWSRETPNGRGQVLLVLELEPDGRLRQAHVEAERSTISRPDAWRCVLDVAQRTPFPASPAGKPTLVEFPLQVVGSSG